MTVHRIVPHLHCENGGELAAFYTEIFDLDVLMQLGWISTLGTKQKAPVQLSLTSDGGDGAPLPDLSIEVDDVDRFYEKAVATGCDVVFAPRNEAWGVRRFFLRDPAGHLLNVLSHQK